MHKSFSQPKLGPGSTATKASSLRYKLECIVLRPRGLYANTLGCALQLPPEDVPEYAKGGHMRGEDIRIYEQTRAEMVRPLATLNNLNFYFPHCNHLGPESVQAKAQGLLIPLKTVRL